MSARYPDMRPPREGLQHHHTLCWLSVAVDETFLLRHDWMLEHRDVARKARAVPRRTGIDIMTVAVRRKWRHVLAMAPSEACKGHNHTQYCAAYNQVSPS